MRQEIKAYNVPFDRHRLQVAYNESGMFVKWIVQMPRASSRGPAVLVSRVAVKSLTTSFPCLTFSIDCAGESCFLQGDFPQKCLLKWRLIEPLWSHYQSDIPLICLCCQPALQWILECWSSEYLLLSNFITKCFLAWCLYSGSVTTLQHYSCLWIFLQNAYNCHFYQLVMPDNGR